MEQQEHRKPEWKLQAAVVSSFHKLQDNGWQFEFAGDMNGVAMSPSQAGRAKLTGMTPGEPDLRIYLKSGRLGMIELKADGGRLSAAQERRHGRLRALGHTIEVVRADNEKDAVDACRAILEAWEAEPKTLH